MSNKKFKNVLVVLGGTSGERLISLESGRACIKALKKKGYKVSTFDPKIKNLNLINKKNIDVIFNALHGRDGEDALKAFKIVSKYENLRPSLEPSHAFSIAISEAKKLSKDTIIVVNSCGDAYKDRKILQERLGIFL